MTVNESIIERQRAHLDQLEQEVAAIPLSEPLATKIRNFISTNFEIDQTKLSFCLATKNFKDKIAAEGSIRHLNKAYILISPGYEKELNKTVNLTDEAKFIIAHEIAHIIHDDNVEGLSHIAKKIEKPILISFAVTGIALTALAWDLFHRPYLSLLFSGAAACGAGIILTGVFKAMKMTQKMERKADIAAANKSREIALGGASYCNRLLSEHQDTRSLSFWQQVFASSMPNPITRTIHAAWKTLHCNFIFDSEGNYRNEWKHPPLSERRDTCIQIAENSFRK